jgi:ABC-type lipoprotein export system ATPase subunit
MAMKKIPKQNQPNVEIFLILDKLSKNIIDEVTTLKEKNNSQKKIELNRKLVTLKHQDYIKTNFEKLTSLINDLTWIEKAEKIKTKTRSTHITNEQKKITTKLIGLNFKEKFAAQASEFNIKIPFEIQITAGEGETSKKLIIGDQNNTSEVSEVLSEGEQNCIAIADFLTEIELAGNISGIIFDDPVTYLDHQRKEIIAKRLVKEAKNRQVIIFTHDIVFAHHLAKSSEDNSINFTGSTISRGSSDQIAGHTNKEIFPHPHYEGKLLEDSKMYLQESKDLNGKEEKEKLELGCSYLRTAYEDFIQKEIFCRVTNRWQEEIKTPYL